jgi:hypothetical protein
MKTVFALLTLFLNSLAIELFLLPDHGSDAHYFFNQAIKKSTSALTVLTNELDSETLEKTIVDLAKKEVEITLIVAPEHLLGISYLAQYRSITLKTLKGLENGGHSGTVQGTMIISDKREACLSTTPLTRQGFRQHIGLAECYLDNQHLKTFRRHAGTLITRSEPYLK